MANTVPGRVTLEMVAAAAGVSRGTASRVLSGSPKVSQDASTAVRAAAAQLGYRPNLSARSLVTGRTGLVGFAVNEDDDRLFTDPYFAQLVRGMHDELTGSDHALVLSLVSDSTERSRLLEFAATRLDGLLLAYGHGDPQLADELAAVGASVVFAGRMPFRGPAEHTTWVDSDSVGGAQAGVQHLLDRGRRRVAHITGDVHMAAGHDRAEGWRRALQQADLPHGDDLTEPGRFREEHGRMATERLLERHPDLDAIFCANDLSALRRAGGPGRRRSPGPRRRRRRRLRRRARRRHLAPAPDHRPPGDPAHGPPDGAAAARPARRADRPGPGGPADDAGGAGDELAHGLPRTGCGRGGRDASRRRAQRADGRPTPGRRAGSARFGRTRRGRVPAAVAVDPAATRA